MTRPRTERKGTRDGFVLIAVLAVMSILSAMVLALLLFARSSVEASAIGSADLRTDAMTQSALTLAAYQLFMLGLPPQQVDGQQVRLDNGTVTLTVASEAGKADLNGSSRNLLAAAYVASGARSLTPAAFAGRVVDWRDGNDDVSREGAEAADYAAAGSEAAPRNGPFRSVDDLRFVLGLSESDVAALRDLVTIYNPRGRLDVFSTPMELIAALPNVAPEVLGTVASLRGTRSQSAVARLSDLFLVQASLIDAEPPAAYRIAVLVEPGGGARVRRFSVVIARGASETAPYQILDWADRS